MIIGGRYEVREQIGKGGMGRVFLVYDRVLDKNWAMKELDERTKGEVEIMRKLDHPALPRVVDIIWHGPKGFLIMDYIDGITLKTYREEKGPATREQFISWGLQLCDALSYLHGQMPSIIYGDLKPSNVIISGDDKLKVVDFGISIEAKKVSNLEGARFGTIGFAAPEQFGKSKKVDIRADIFSLGRTLLYISNRQDTSPSLEKIIHKCCRTSPQRRYQNCLEIRKELLCASKPRKIKHISTLFIGIVCLVTFILTAFCIINVRKESKIQQYGYLLRQEGSKEEKEKHFYTAIQLMPEKIYAYRQLADLYMTMNFTSERQRIFHQIITENEGLFYGEKGYGDLCFEIGCLYGAGSKAENVVMNMRWALPWFEKAMAEQNLISAYDKQVVKAFLNASHFCSRLQGKLTFDSVCEKEYLSYFKKYRQDVRLLKMGSVSCTKRQFSILMENMMEFLCHRWKEVGVSKEVLIQLTTYFSCSNKRIIEIRHKIRADE